MKNPQTGKIFAEVKPSIVKVLPIPKITTKQQQPFIEKAEIMLSKNRELHDVSFKFLSLLKAEFNLEKLSNKLEQWYTLSFAEFMAELTKQKKVLSLKQKAEWMEYFEKQKAIATAIKTTIDNIDHEIDQMVYALYGLTPEEIAIVEGVK